jgi:hypothetical protein
MQIKSETIEEIAEIVATIVAQRSGDNMPQYEIEDWELPDMIQSAMEDIIEVASSSIMEKLKTKGVKINK